MERQFKHFVLPVLKHLYFIQYQLLYTCQRYTLLQHTITMADGYCLVFFGLVIYGNAEWSAYGILPAVALAYCIFFFIKTLEMWLTCIHKFTGYFR